MKITYLGTTVLLFDDGQDQILFDAHFTRPSLPRFLFTQLHTDKAVTDEVLERFGIDRLRAVFVSHTHTDHVLDMPYVALRTGANVYGSASAMNVAIGGGVPGNRLRPFIHGETYTEGAFRVKVLASRHSKPNLFNNDLGQPIETPIIQPAGRKAYREGGSYDFLVTHGSTAFLIRPSCAYVEGQLDDITADVLYLGISGLTKLSPVERKRFFAETVDKVRPSLVVPLHWDNFFSPLFSAPRGMPRFIEDTPAAFRLLTEHCVARGIACVIQPPLSFMNCP